jgi:3-oxoacyl-[acyl-carrier protein] reductase
MGSGEAPIKGAIVRRGGGMSAAQIFDLTGQVALVTGASSGLGERFAEVLAANGADVVLVARRAERLAAVTGRITKSGRRAISVAADVRDTAAMRRAFDTAERQIGTVTILVNNAGIVHSGRAVELKEEVWRNVLATNLDAVFFWAQEAARRMLAAGKKGSIVNIASVLGLSPDKGVIAYAAAKAGVIQLTKALALELGFKGIRVNAIAPGWITTEINRDYLASERGSAMKRQIPMGHFGEVEDLDGPLLLLASDAGRFMTGATVVADGGQLAALHV